MRQSSYAEQARRSRSTWACELKCIQIDFFSHSNVVTLHVSVWVEIQTRQDINREIRVTLHVSVWVEMPVIATKSCIFDVTLHVSVWVEMPFSCTPLKAVSVTLHVSVWVEISVSEDGTVVAKSRSTWACELKLKTLIGWIWVQMSRSTWACELKCCTAFPHRPCSWSRSTWACELKLRYERTVFSPFRHAPRERVSWNLLYSI